MPDKFGSAAALYKKNIHPRVLTSADDLQRIRKLIRSGEGKKIHAAVSLKANKLADRIESIGAELPKIVSQWNDRWDLPGTAIVWGTHDIAFIGALDRDERLIAAAKKLMLAFVEADRLKGRVGNKTVGYGMEPYTLLAYDLLFDHFTPAERRLIVDWVIDFGVRLTFERLNIRYMREAGANIPMGEVLTGMMGLLMVEGDEGAPDLSKEKARFVTFLEATVNSALGLDGYPVEDVGYGTGMGGWIAYLVEAAYRAGIFNAYERSPNFPRFGQAVLHFVQPWGKHLSNTGDHGDDFGQRGFVLSRIAARTADPSIEWLRRTLMYPSALSGPRERDPLSWGEVQLSANEQLPTCAFSLITLGESPRAKHPRDCRVPTSFMDRGRGLVTFRSSWRDDAAFVVFDGSQRSPSASGHDHASGGHFSLSAMGEYFGIDTGRYNMEQDQHNVVLINGKSGRTTNGEWRFMHEPGILTEYSPGKFVDTASADYSHQANCIWARRTIGLVKGDLPYVWTVEDVNYDHGKSGLAEYWWALNTHPENRIDISRGHATIRGCRHGNLLDVHFGLLAENAFPIPHKLALEKNLQLSGSHAYVLDPLKQAKAYRKSVGDLVHGPVFARPRLVAKVTGYIGRFMSVMVPRAKGKSPLQVKRVESLDNTLAMTITFERYEDTIIWAYEHRMLEANSISARGQWCVVRRALRNGKPAGVIAHAVGGEGKLYSPAPRAW